MLPFLQKKEGSTAAKEEKTLPKSQNKGESAVSLEIAMRDLFAAKDNEGRAAAFKAAFKLLESQPHKEAGK